MTVAEYRQAIEYANARLRKQPNKDLKQLVDEATDVTDSTIRQAYDRHRVKEPDWRLKR
jgi:hypothetical protein